MWAPKEKGIMRDTIRKIVDDYKSVKLLGQDEGYVVFTGEEPDSKAAVAIKILPRLLGEDPQIARSFRSLSRAVRQLNHPNIASVRKVGEEEGLPYLITRALEEAQPLAAKLNQPWAVDVAADVVMQVGQALEHAYNKGVVHGSLNPDNIVVEDDGRVMVTDFGLTELQNLVGVHLEQATTPFVAPEREGGGEASSRADVYSLAAVLYSMLANRPPEMAEGQVVPPSHFNEDVAPAMDAVVVKALAQDPAERYPDAKSFLAAFGSVTLAPTVKKRTWSVTANNRCSRCGAKNQSSRFCRKCGARLEEEDRHESGSILDEPIQVTTVEVKRTGIEVGEGVNLRETIIAQPMSVATGEMLAEFPEPMPVPRFDLAAMWPAVDDQSMLAMPEPPPMPVVDWAEIAPPMPEVPKIGDTDVTAEDD
jgi:serine/threonine protein kinase